MTQAVAGQAEKPTYDIFYLAVGSSHYRKLPRTNISGKQFEGFSDLKGAPIKSAKYVSEQLDYAGALAGITLISDYNRLVTRADVFKALEAIVAQAKKSPAKNPLVVFYFCGHGVSEGFAWNHFSLTGDFNADWSQLNVETMAEKTVYAGAVADFIEERKIPFLLLFDTCYEGKEEPLAAAVISQQLAANIKDISGILRAFNEFRGPDLVIYAAKPGTTVPVVDDPVAPKALVGVGRLARRLVKSFNAAQKVKDSLPIEKFFKQMTEPVFDPATATIVSKSQPAKPSVGLIKTGKKARTSNEVRFGSGSLTVEPLMVGENKTTKQPVPYRVLPASYLEFNSEPGEFIGDGKNLKLTTSQYNFVLTEGEADKIAFSIEHENRSWEISFVAPKGETLGAKSYLNSQRTEFKDDDKPGFSFSGDGRGCNEVQAQFTILKIERDSYGQIIRFEADFEQQCDGSTTKLRGRFRYSAEPAA